MKILYITTVSGTMDFFIDIISTLIEQGNQVDLACSTATTPINAHYSELGCRVHELSCSRKLSFTNVLKTISDIKILIENEEYDIVHCHTPIASFCTRVACRKLNVKVVYTAHGFHFFKGAPLKNWLIYYPAEKLCSRWTDVLVTINSEDYELAKKKMKAKKVTYVPGVGIDENLYQVNDNIRMLKRKELGIPEDAYVILTVGDLNENKNQSIILDAMKNMNDDSVYLLIAGMGQLEKTLKQLAEEYDLNDRVFVLGFRTDVPELYAAADVVCHPSRREGLSVTIMESMSCGLPVVCSDIRGNRDLIIDKKGGYLCESDSVEDFKHGLEQLKDLKTRKQFGLFNQSRIHVFSRSEVNPQILTLYKEVL